MASEEKESEDATGCRGPVPRKALRRTLSAFVGACLVGAAGVTSAAPTAVQDNWGQQDGAGHATCTWNKNINAGDLLIATVTYTGGTGTTITPSSMPGGGGTWTEIPSGHGDNGASIGVRMYYLLNASTNTTKPTESWAVSPSTAEVALQLHEISGVQATGALDAAAVATGGASPAVVSATASAGTAAELTFVVFGVRSAGAVLSTPTNAASASYANLTSAGTSPLLASATPTTANTKTQSSFLSLSAVSGSSVSASLTQTPATNWAAAIATFQLTAIHWIGAGGYPVRPAVSPNPAVCYGFIDDHGCWSSTSGGPNNVGGPGASDVVVFDAGGTGDVTSNPLAGGTENAFSIEMKPGYTGTLNVTDRLADVPDLKLAGPLLVEGGTVTLGASQLQVVGTTTMNSATTFNGASATETFGGALTIATGTMSLGPSPTLTGNTQIGSAATSGVLTLSSGTVSHPGTLTIDGASSVFNGGTTNLTVVGKTTIDFGGTLNAGASGTKTFTGVVALGTTAGLTSGTFRLNGSTALFNNGSGVTLQGGSTFDASAGGAVTFGTNVVAGVSAITLTNGSMNLSGAATTIAGAGSVTITTGTMTLGAGSLTFPGNLNVNGGLDAGASTSLTVNGNLAMSAGTFHAKSTALDVKGTTTLNTSSVFDSVAATVTLENALQLNGTASLDLSNATASMTTGTASVGTGTTLKLGATAFTFPGTLSVSGTLVAGNGARTFVGALTVSGAYTAGTGAHAFSSTVTNTAGTLDLTSAASLSFGGTLTLNGIAVTTFGAQTVTLPALTVTGGTFHAGTSQLTISGATASGGTLDMASAASLSFGGSFTLTSGTTTFGAQTITMPSLSIIAAGTITGGTGALTVSGLTTITGGVVNLAAATSGPTFTGAVSMNNGVLSLGAANNATMQNTFTMTGGTFNGGVSTAAQLTFAGAVSINGTARLANFNANTGTLIFNGAMAVCECTAVVGNTGTFNANTSTSTFNGPVTIGGSDGTRGRFHAQGATINFAFPTTMLSPDSVLMQGAPTTAIDTNATIPFPTITFGANAVAGTNALDVVAGTLPFSNGTTAIFNPPGGAGNVSLGAGTSMTMTGIDSTFAQTVTIAGTLTGGSGALTFSGPVSVSGAFAGGNGARVYASTLTVSGAFSSSAGAHTSSGTLTNSAGTLDLHNSSSATFNAGANLVVSGGTTTLGSYAGVTTTIPALTITSGGFDTATNATRLTISGATSISGGVANMASTRGATLTGAVSVSGGALTLGAGGGALGSTLDISGGVFTAGSGAVSVTSAATVTAAGVLNGGSSTNLRFNGPVTLGTVAAGSPGSFYGGTATTTFTAAFSLLGGSIFGGAAGAATFTVAPTLTSGTFSVGTVGTLSRQTFTAGATFSSGVTLSFPSDKGELRLGNGQALTLNGPVISSVGTASTLPKIDCGACALGMTVTFGATSTLNINGLELDDSVAAGVSIASGATYTLLGRLKFQGNKANSTSTGATHLAITSPKQVLVIPGCSFDATAQYNVTLTGTMASPGVRAIFELKDATLNGARAGDAFDLDADTNDDNVADSVAASRWGSVVEWVDATAADTSGVAVGFPTPAFDWNTFTPYGVYAAFTNVNGANDDVIFLRNGDGTAAYSYTVADASGNLTGTPWWDTDGSGAHVLYLATSLGHVIKLVDNGVSLSQPLVPPWSSEFFDNTKVATITSPLIEDGTNLYFGGTDGGGNEIFGLAISTKLIAKTVGAAGAVTDSPSWKIYGGTTDLFVGSQAVMGTAFVYRVDMGVAMVTASFPATASINNSVRLINNRAYAVTDGGTMHVLDAPNFTTGGFKNLPGFPYQSAAASPIKSAPYIDPSTNFSYFGDVAGNLYVVTAAGTDLTGYPYALTGVSGASALSSSPLYLASSGVVAVGAADGYVYFVDRHNGSNSPQLFKKYFAGAGAVSSVAYNTSTSDYMVSTTDGRLVFIKASDVADPTSAFE